jgi:colicin import membrane protein
VAAARGAALEAERALRGDPPPALAEAQALLAEARRRYREAFDAAKDETYAFALAARKTAEARLQKAERDDPARARLEAARKAWQDQRQAALARDPDVRRAQEEHDKAAAAQREAEDRARGLRERATDEARALRDGDDPRIAAARAKLEAARKALRDVENAPETLAAKAKADAARRALEAKAREAAMADPSYRAAADELARIEAQLAAPGPVPSRP